MANKKRAVALAVALTVCFAVLLSAVFIISEADHDCSGEHCPICLHIHNCENTLKNLLAFDVYVAVCLTAVCFCMHFMPVFFKNRSNISLITLKVKLSS